MFVSMDKLVTRKRKVTEVRGVYYDKSLYGEIVSTPVYDDRNFPPNKGIWKWSRWLQVWDLWLLVSVRKLLSEIFWGHFKHFACIIFSITLFTGVLMMQKPITPHNKLENYVPVSVNKTTNISPTYQVQNYSQNEETKVKIHNRSEDNESNKNKNISTLSKETEMQPFKKNGCSLTEASVRRIVQEELERYGLKRRNEKATSIVSENTIRKIVTNELMKYSSDRMMSVASVVKILEKSTRKMISEELAIYDADKLGMPDYALETVGGRIISASDTDGFGSSEYIQIFGFNIWKFVSGGPRNIIQPNVHPGNCWAFQGSHANVVIQLSNPIHITAVSMEHIPASISPTGNINSAPKDFAVIGLIETNANHQIHLGAFTYMKEGPPRQTFTTVPEKIGARQIFKAVELHILSNHGSPEFTCVYRFRVHGQLME